MMAQNNQDPKRLIPEEPPKRLPEDELSRTLLKDPAFRRRSGLLHTLRHQPRRLFTTQAPSRRFSKSVRRELFYRLTASVTSFALLVSLIAVGGPFFIWNGAQAVVPDYVIPDYSWLETYIQNTNTADTSYVGTYTVSSANQLKALARLVNGLTAANTESNPWKDLSDPDATAGYTIVASDTPGYTPMAIVNMLPLISEELPVVSEPLVTASGVLPEPSQTIAPVETPSAESPAPEPSVSASAEPSPPESPAATPPATAEPTAQPSAEPAATPPPAETTPPQPDALPALPGGGSGTTSVALAATARGRLVLVGTVDEPGPTAAPEITPAPVSTPEPTVPSTPEPPAEPTPAPTPLPTVEPTPEPSPTPATTETPIPEPTPTLAPTEVPVQTETPLPTATPTVTETPLVTESLPLLLAANATAAMVHVPVGLAKCRILLDSDIDMVNFFGTGEVGGYEWTPIGTSSSKFLGIFDGNSKKVINFQFAPPNNCTAYGLFGYVGSTGVVKNLNFDLANPNADAAKKTWNIAFSSKLTTVGVLAASSEGIISGCTIKNASVIANFISNTAAFGPLVGTLQNSAVIDSSFSLNNSISYTALKTNSRLSIGGIAGLVSVPAASDKATLSRCVFTGSVKNTTSMLELNSLAIGGIIGAAIGTDSSASSTAVAVLQCASGVDFDAYLSTSGNNTRGVGGLLGNAHCTVTTIDQSFSTGTIRANVSAGGLVGSYRYKYQTSLILSDSYSSVTLGASTAANGLNSNTQSTSAAEAVGGLLGYIDNAVTISNTYFSGGLLEPQYSSVVGYYIQQITQPTTLFIDATQAPHSVFKATPKTPITATFTDKLSTVFTGDNAIWSRLTGSNPALKWAAEPSPAVFLDSTLSGVVKALSDTASRQWAPVSTENAWSGADGFPSTYRMKALLGDGFGGLTRTTVYQDSSSALIVGGLYTANPAVGDFQVPIIRKLLLSVHQDPAQTAGQADLIQSGDDLRRFICAVNLGGGGYLGSKFTIAAAKVDASSVTVPAWDVSHAPLFCGTLSGSGSTVSTISDLSFADNASGMISRAYFSTFQNFGIDGAHITSNSSGSVNSAYFGVLAGQVIGVNATNITISNASYEYIYTTNTDIGSNGGFGFLFGSADSSESKISGCTVSSSKFLHSASGKKAIKLNAGGLVGNNNSTLTMTDCKVDATIVFSSDGYTSSGGAKFVPNIGGLVGHSELGTTTATRCSVLGQYSGGNTGGMIGRSYNATLTDCAFAGELSTSSGLTSTGTHLATNTGGMIGYVNNEGSTTTYTPSVTITRCSAMGNLSASTFAGGLLGFTILSPKLTDSYFTGILTNTDTARGAAGGLIGYAKIVLGGKVGADVQNPTLTRCYFAGQVSGRQPGGLIGQMDNDMSAAAPAGDSLLWANAVFDSDLMLPGAKTVGNATIVDRDIAEGSGKFPQCGAPGGTAAWTALFSPNATWNYTDIIHSYPRFSAAHPAASESTLRPFRIGSSLSIFSLLLGGRLELVLPSTVSHELTGPLGKKDSSTDAGYTTTPYSADDAGDGTIKLSYQNLNVNGAPLTITYKALVKMFEYGEGTESSPFIIHDMTTLETLRRFTDLEKSLGVHFIISKPPIQNEDGSLTYNYEPTTIDMSEYANVDNYGTNWPSTSKAFAGILHGNNSTIQNLTIAGQVKPDIDSTKTQWNAGLFGSLSSDAVLSDLTLSNIKIPNPTTSAAIFNAGTLCAQVTGKTTLNNITVVDSSITVNRRGNLGGLIGLYNTTDSLTLTGLSTDVIIASATGDLDGSAGGLIGSISPSSASNEISISKCVSYAAISGQSNMGGLVGSVSSAGRVSLSNSYSLSSITNSLNLSRVSAGGLIGFTASAPTITTCYYAGQNNVAYRDHSGTGWSTSYSFPGGLIGRLENNSSAVTGTYYNSDANPFSPWIHKTGENAYAPTTDAADSLSFSYCMSQPADKRTAAMKTWDTSVWTFTDGLYPRLAWQSADDTLTFNHIAVHFTNAKGTRDAYQNLYVRYSGAALTAADSTLLKSVSAQQMLVSTNNGTAQESVNLTWKSHTRAISVTPGVDSMGRVDASIYLMNKDGMSKTTPSDGSAAQSVWSIYTADALAGLAGAVNAVSSATDSYGLPLDNLGQNKSSYRYSLMRDLDLGAYPNWTPIGTNAKPFLGQFDGSGGSANSRPGHQITGLRTSGKDAENTAAALGLFGVIDGGEVRSLALFPYTDAAAPQNNGALRLTAKQTSVGAIAGSIRGGATIEDCFTSVPIYGSAANGVAVGGIVGRIEDADSLLSRCAATGYIYLTPTDGNAVADTGPAAGGLVGEALLGGIVSSSYASGYVDSSAAGGVVGRISTDAPLKLTSVSYDGNANGSLTAAGNGGTLTAATTVPDDMSGSGWTNSGTGTGLYPLQEVFVNESAQLKASRVRMTHSSSARSATGGTMNFANGVLQYDAAAQPAFIATGDRVLLAVDKKSYTKKSDGLAELWVSDAIGSTASRRVLINLRCWYDNYTTTPGEDGKTIRNFTIREASELAELAEIVNGTISNPDTSKVGHTHTLHSGKDFDDFSGCVITLTANIDLTTLKENNAQRLWTSIGTSNSFAGTFDGAGYAVSGMWQNQSLDASGSGLFGSVSGTIKNLLVTNASLTLTTNSAGLIAGSLEAGGEISTCGSSGVLTLNGLSGSAGGLVGTSAGTISGCFSTAEMKGTEGNSTAATMGGIVGTSSGQVLNSYFAGYCTHAQSTVGGTVGGIAGHNTGSVGQSYVAAYLNGATVNHIAPGDSAAITDCYYDGRFTSKTGGHGTEKSGNGLVLSGDAWVQPVSNTYYPRLKALVLDADGKEIPVDARTPLAQAGDLAAAQFQFSGAVSSKFNNFTTVTVAARETSGFLLAGTSNLMVSGSKATAADGAGGSAYLYYNAGTSDSVLAKNPCYLVIPATLGVSYQFNWAELIQNAKLPAGSPAIPAKYDLLIDDVATLQEFVSDVSAGTTFSGETVVLGANILLSAGFTPMSGGEFLGTFNGNGYTISNYNASAPFFSQVGVGGVVKQLCFENATVKAGGSGTVHAAIVAGVNAGRIVNVAVEGGTVTGTQNSRAGATYIGGLVAENLGTLEASYFYTTSALQFSGSVPEAAIDQFYMGGIAGSNGGHITGCYSSTDYQVSFGSQVTSTPSQYVGTMVGYNAGTVDYSYWKDYQGTIVLDNFVAYRTSNPDDHVTAANYYFKYENLSTVCQWLSVDTHGGAYYVDGHPKLYCFELLKYDLTGVFGGKDGLQYAMLSLQYTSNGNEALSANGLTSWMFWQFPNFSNITETSSLSLKLPMLSSLFDYTISASVITKDTSEFTPLTYTTSPLSQDGTFTVSWKENPLRVLFKIDLFSAKEQEAPWGVYRVDSTSRLN